MLVDWSWFSNIVKVVLCEIPGLFNYSIYRHLTESKRTLAQFI